MPNLINITLLKTLKEEALYLETMPDNSSLKVNLAKIS